MTSLSFINEEKRPYPFCPGCSHGRILDRLNEALSALNVNHSDVVIVTDIGCVGLSDQWFVTHAFHGLHGRSVLYGEGLKLASPDLHVIVLMGDGGAGVGLHHLISAARRNINITVVIFNNFNFGMTGGEHSVTTPFGSMTSTTRSGNPETPANIIDTLLVNGAGFTARRLFSDEDLAEILKQAILYKGYSTVEVFEFCTAYFTMFNRFGKKAMESMLDTTGLNRMLNVIEDKPGYQTTQSDTDSGVTKQKQGRVYDPVFQSSIDGSLSIIIAGSAGQKIQSTASLFAGAAILSGLYASQRDDYPVTVKSGHSLSFIRLSSTPSETLATGTPDILFILSENGLKKSTTYLKNMSKNDSVYILKNLPEVSTQADVVTLDPENTGTKIPHERLPLTALSSWIKQNPVIPLKALKKSAEINYGQKSAEGLSRLMDSVSLLN